jgi:hypothetical protein
VASVVWWNGRGLLGFVFSQSPEFVAPFGAYEPVFGTNPFSIGIPMKARGNGQQLGTWLYEDTTGPVSPDSPATGTL